MTAAALDTPRDSKLMSTGFIIGLILISVFSFSALIGLSGYADDIRDKNNGQAHALSSSAIGFGGLNLFLERLGYNVRLDPNEARFNETKELRIYTLNSAFQTDALDDLNEAAPKLIILPKWNVTPVSNVSGWVRKSPFTETQNETLLKSNLESLIEDIEIIQAEDNSETRAKEYIFTVLNTELSYASPMGRLQTIGGPRLIPLITNENHYNVLVQIKGTKTYILSDPDFLNTSALNTRTGARFAVDVLDYLQKRTETDGFVLDLALHGLGGRQNMIKLFTQPPFLSITVLTVMLIALLGWQAFLRFGDPLKRQAEDLGDDLQMGPQSLARTTAEFLAITRRQTDLMPDYAQLVRDQTLGALNAAGATGKNRNLILDKRETERALSPDFAQLNSEAKLVSTPQDMLRLATALQNWKKDMIK